MMGGNTTNKDLEHRIEGLEKILENSQRDNYKIHQETQAVIVESEKKNHQLAKDSMNSMMEKLFKQVQLLGAKSNSEEEEEVGSEIGSAKILDRAQILFPTFDGTNYREWRAKVEQFFEFENTPQA